MDSIENENINDDTAPLLPLIPRETSFINESVHLDSSCAT